MLTQLLRVEETRKAYVGALTTTLGSVVVAVGPESTTGKVITIIITAIVSLLAVFQTPNKATT